MGRPKGTGRTVPKETIEEIRSLLHTGAISSLDEIAPYVGVQPGTTASRMMVKRLLKNSGFYHHMTLSEITETPAESNESGFRR